MSDDWELRIYTGTEWMDALNLQPESVFILIVKALKEGYELKGWTDHLDLTANDTKVIFRFKERT